MLPPNFRGGSLGQLILGFMVLGIFFYSAVILGAAQGVLATVKLGLVVSGLFAP